MQHHYTGWYFATLQLPRKAMGYTKAAINSDLTVPFPISGTDPDEASSLCVWTRHRIKPILGTQGLS